MFKHELITMEIEKNDFIVVVETNIEKKTTVNWFIFQLVPEIYEWRVEEFVESFNRSRKWLQQNHTEYFI